MADAATRAPLQREAIIETARALVTEEGLDQLSLRRLATRLGVTAPALYAYVNGKQDLLRALAEDEFDRLMERFAAIDEPDPVARIRAQGRAYVEHARENPQMFRVMFLFPPDLGSGGLPPGIELPGATRAFAAAAAAVEDAVATGAIVADDPLLVALSLWSGSHGVASVLQLGVDLPVELEEALIDDVTARILRGYAP
jgi:AcrR family transcriptional regulator